jgi:hypothetical protein
MIIRLPHRSRSSSSHSSSNGISPCQATIPVVYEQRGVFYKQRDSGFFPTSSAVVAMMLVQIPIQVRR